MSTQYRDRKSHGLRAAIELNLSPSGYNSEMLLFTVIFKQKFNKKGFFFVNKSSIQMQSSNVSITLKLAY